MAFIDGLALRPVHTVQQFSTLEQRQEIPP
jgi:hypothetical protein